MRRRIRDFADDAFKLVLDQKSAWVDAFGSTTTKRRLWPCDGKDHHEDDGDDDEDRTCGTPNLQTKSWFADLRTNRVLSSMDIHRL